MPLRISAGVLVTVISVAATTGASAYIGYTAEVTGQRERYETNDWPAWRGLHGDNHSIDQSPPLHWDAERGVIWKSPAPGHGHASPIIAGDRVFVASADDVETTQFLLCFDRQSGAQLWKTDLHHGSLPTINQKNSHASATPTTDGKYVYALFAQTNEITLSAVDFGGHIAWQKAVGAYKHANGLGSSPALFGNYVIVASDNPAAPQMVAFNRDNGEVAWRTPRRASENSATPIVAHVADRPQVLINGAYGVNSYDPQTGKELWHVTHNTEVAACTMAFDDRNVFASGNVPEPCMLGIHADGSGDVTESHVLWRTKQSNTYVPSPLVANGYLFVVIDSGVAFCRELNTGKIVWRERLGGSFSASPLLAGENIYATSEDGTTHVFKALPTFTRVSKNVLGGSCLASPVICGGCVYIRTDAELYCIGGEETR